MRERGGVNSNSSTLSSELISLLRTKKKRGGGSHLSPFSTEAVNNLEPRRGLNKSAELLNFCINSEMYSALTLANTGKHSLVILCFYSQPSALISSYTEARLSVVAVFV